MSDPSWEARERAMGYKRYLDTFATYGESEVRLDESANDNLALADALDAAERALRDIASRDWQDEGGRIAAAIARDALREMGAE